MSSVNMLVQMIAFFVALLGFALFSIRRSLRYLHILQQDDYNGARFLGWLVDTRSFDKRVSLTLLLVACIGAFMVNWIAAWNNNFVVAIVFALFAVSEPDPRKDAKKKLVITNRAKRIFSLALMLEIISGGMLLATDMPLAAILAVQIIPLWLVLANVFLIPVEARIQQRYMREASIRLRQINPHIIGITGSFGKTSVKHILGHILEMNAPTFFTPGSVNTLMGISRIIRENLPADCRYFLVEMGAYGEGSIRKLCALTPPATGIITALGEAHIERFQTLDTVARAKFELAEAVLAHEAGRMIVHENVLAQDYAAQFVNKYPGRFTICGSKPDAAVQMESVEQSTAGLTVHVKWKEQGYILSAPLFGTHHAGNMVLAFATAVMLGVTPERALAALRTTPQIKHRLEVKPQPNGSIYIDDAFNSNPSGFVAALELMTLLAGGNARRRVLVTPGLIELGDRHDAVHAALGDAAAKHADIALAVHPDRIPSFIDGFVAAKTEGVLTPVANLAEAQKWLAANGKPDDIVLIENDLPDVHERRLEI